MVLDMLEAYKKRCDWIIVIRRLFRYRRFLCPFCRYPNRMDLVASVSWEFLRMVYGPRSDDTLRPEVDKDVEDSPDDPGRVYDRLRAHKMDVVKDSFQVGGIDQPSQFEALFDSYLVLCVSEVKFQDLESRLTSIVVSGGDHIASRYLDLTDTEVFPFQ